MVAIITIGFDKLAPGKEKVYFTPVCTHAIVLYGWSNIFSGDNGSCDDISNNKEIEWG